MTTEWTKVEDKLPAYDRLVLTYSSGDYILGRVRPHNGYDEWEDDIGDEFEPDYWMDLPPMPFTF
jgi:hypothetical protein